MDQDLVEALQARLQALNAALEASAQDRAKEVEAFVAAGARSDACNELVASAYASERAALEARMSAVDDVLEALVSYRSNRSGARELGGSELEGAVLEARARAQLDVSESLPQEHLYLASWLCDRSAGDIVRRIATARRAVAQEFGESMFEQIQALRAEGEPESLESAPIVGDPDAVLRANRFAHLMLRRDVRVKVYPLEDVALHALFLLKDALASGNLKISAQNTNIMWRIYTLTLTSVESVVALWDAALKHECDRLAFKAAQSGSLGTRIGVVQQALGGSAPDVHPAVVAQLRKQALMETGLWSAGGSGLEGGGAAAAARSRRVRASESRGRSSGSKSSARGAGKSSGAGKGRRATSTRSAARKSQRRSSATRGAAARRGPRATKR